MNTARSLCVLTLVSGLSAAEETWIRLLAVPMPWRNAVTTTTTFNGTAAADVDGFDRLAFRRFGAAAVFRAHASERWTVLATTAVDHVTIDQNQTVRFKRSGNAVPDELTGLSLGIAVRHIDEARRSWVAGLGISSHSDKPFDDGDVVTLNAFAGVRLPTAERDSWLLGMTWRSRTDYPLPLVAYSWQASEEWSFTLGVPLLMARWQQGSWDASFRTIAVNARADVGWRPSKMWRLGATAGRVAWSSLIADRADDDDELRHHAWNLGLTARFGPARFPFLSAEAGYAVGRELIEQNGWDLFGGDDDEESIDLDPAPYARVSLQWAW